VGRFVFQVPGAVSDCINRSTSNEYGIRVCRFSPIACGALRR
jgi:hypothetical protein